MSVSSSLGMPLFFFLYIITLLIFYAIFFHKKYTFLTVIYS
ncbi:hypothetical protein HMPREF1548_05270 [Clostridium sp. KLE 1755]|nr:hypothetical protein HMPREF1548_05270 [Clostridium sp. KLE 1755]